MNPKTKIFYQGRQINGRFDTLKAKATRAYRFIKRATYISLAAYLIFMAGALFYSTSTVTASTDVITVEAKSPVLERIADCESGNGKAGTATQTRKGQVLISINTNGTYDQGKYQINSIHNAEASALGFNLATEEGNTAYAKYLYANKGTGDWASSSHCWAR